MTTIVGIVNRNNSAGILVADMQETAYSADNSPVAKWRGEKLIVGEHFALAQTGVMDTATSKFLLFMKGHRQYGSNPQLPDKLVASALERRKNYLKGRQKKYVPHFQRIADECAEQSYRGEEMENMNHFLMISNIDKKVQISFINPWGMIFFPSDLEVGVESVDSDSGTFDYMTVGSGSEYAKSYLSSELDKRNGSHVTIDDLIEMGVNSLTVSGRDPGTSSFPSGGGLIAEAIVTRDSVIYESSIPEAEEMMKKHKERLKEKMKSS